MQPQRKGIVRKEIKFCQAIAVKFTSLAQSLRFYRRPREEGVGKKSWVKYMSFKGLGKTVCYEWMSVERVSACVRIMCELN